VSADAVRGRRATGYRPIKDDVENAGGEWVDAEVVQDGNVITSRTPDDLPAFARAIVEFLSSTGETNERSAAVAVAS
jgi:protease I